MALLPFWVFMGLLLLGMPVALGPADVAAPEHVASGRVV